MNFVISIQNRYNAYALDKLKSSTCVHINVDILCSFLEQTIVSILWSLQSILLYVALLNNFGFCIYLSLQYQSYSTLLNIFWIFLLLSHGIRCTQTTVYYQFFYILTYFTIFYGANIHHVLFIFLINCSLSLAYRNYFLFSLSTILLAPCLSL